MSGYPCFYCLSGDAPIIIMSRSSKNSDKELKDQGNKYFSQRNFEAALDCYSRAIQKNPGVPHYYTNRALCFMNQKRWDMAISDAKRALDKDPHLVKGHFYLGKDFKTTCYILTGRQRQQRHLSR